MIPKRLVRTVPADTSDQVEAWWQQACQLHPGWEYVTLRDPIDPADFPLTSALWSTCESGAQLGDLVKTEALFWDGGVFLDSDVICWRSFEPLLGLDGVVAYEDAKYIPNAVFAFTPAHPALRRAIELAIQRHNQGTWAAGVGAFTEVMKDRTDIAILPPGSFFPVHWREAHKKPINVDKVRAENPAAYTLHLYEYSWKNAKCAQ